MAEYHTHDEVTLKGVLGCSNADGLWCVFLDGELDGVKTSVWVHPRQFVSHIPKPRELKVGEMVTWGVELVGWPLVFTGKEMSVVDQCGEPYMVRTSDLEPWPTD